MMRKKVALIGPFGEIGGVSMHLNRLKFLLKEEFDFYLINESKKFINDDNTLNLRGLNLIKYLCTIARADYVHIHSGHIYLRLFHIFAGTFLLRNNIVTLHSFRHTTHLHDILLKKFAYKIITVSQEIYNKLGDENAIILNAFIPPVTEAEGELDKNIMQLINNKKKGGRFIISANAFRIVYQNNRDLYGVDQLISLSKLFKEKSFPGFIIFVIGSLLNCEESFRKYCQRIEEEGLSEYILLYPKSLSFVKLIENTDLVLRPTTSDGDALTVREALYLNRPVIASDVVERPAGTCLYKSGNVNDLFEKILKILNKEMNLKSHKNNIDFKDIYQKIYS